MSRGLNKCQFIGNAGKEADLRYTASGLAVANFSLAVTRTWKRKDGEKQEETEWVRCVAFGKLADLVAQYVKKGEKLYCEGGMQTSKWEDNGGQLRETTKIVLSDCMFLSSQKDKKGFERKSQVHQQRKAERQQVGESDIPF